jgi:hypothetical protein
MAKTKPKTVLHDNNFMLFPLLVGTPFGLGEIGKKFAESLAISHLLTPSGWECIV